MARPSALIRPGPAQSGLDQGNPKSSKHKVVLESVTQEKKRLRSVVCCFRPVLLEYSTKMDLSSSYHSKPSHQKATLSFLLAILNSRML